MKKIISLIFIIVLLCGCGKKEYSVTTDIDYGESDLYTREDMQEAIVLIMNEFLTWDGREMVSIAYMGDEYSQSAIEYCNSLFDDTDYVYAMVFTSEYKSGSTTTLAANSGITIPDLLWYTAREEDGEWELISWGYDGILTYAGED